MPKPDTTVKAVVTAAIRRHSMEMDEWGSTRLWDEADEGHARLMAADLRLEVGEEPILYSLVSDLEWTLFTSRAVEYAHEGRRDRVAIASIEKHSAGNFKGYRRQAAELLELTTTDGAVHRCPYVTGKPSIGTLYALSTLLRVAT